MSLKKLHKVTSLPVTKDNDALYFVQNGAFADFYITDSSGNEKIIVNDIRINDLITSQLSSINAMEIVADITARNALTLTANVLVLVLDASGDSTVTSGWATYAYRHSDTSFNKIAEHESQDISLSWANLVDKPTSSINDIDDAVNKKHSHWNLTVLDKFTEVGGEVLYNGDKLNSWNSLDW